MIEAIKKRRSVRGYLAENVGEEKIKEILLAASYAPSANAKYPWKLVVVKDPQTREILSKATPWSLHVKDAPIVIVVIGDEKESPDWVEDCSVVAEHIWLEAENQGLASCWTQIRGNENAEKEIKKTLELPEELRVLCLMPIGIPASVEPEHNEEEFDKSRISYEKY